MLLSEQVPGKVFSSPQIDYLLQQRQFVEQGCVALKGHHQNLKLVQNFGRQWKLELKLGVGSQECTAS